MWKNRLGYILFFAAVMVMLVISGKPYLLGVLIVLLLLAVSMGVFTRRDATDLKIFASAPSGAQEGKENFFTRCLCGEEDTDGRISDDNCL